MFKINKIHIFTVVLILCMATNIAIPAFAEKTSNLAAVKILDYYNSLESQVDYITPTDGIDKATATTMIDQYLTDQGFYGLNGRSVKEITTQTFWDVDKAQLFIDSDGECIAIIKDNKVLDVLYENMQTITLKAYLADIDNDSIYEICVTASIGSGWRDDRIYVYDIEDNIRYELSDRDNGVLYSLHINSDRLSLDLLKSNYNLGRLVLKDGSLMSETEANGYFYTIDSLKAVSYSGEELGYIPKNGGFTVSANVVKRVAHDNIDYFVITVYNKADKIISSDYVKVNFAERKNYFLELDIPTTTDEIGSVKAQVNGDFSAEVALSKTKDLELGTGNTPTLSSGKTTSDLPAIKIWNGGYAVSDGVSYITPKNGMDLKTTSTLIDQYIYDNKITEVPTWVAKKEITTKELWDSCYAQLYISSNNKYFAIAKNDKIVDIQCPGDSNMNNSEIYFADINNDMHYEICTVVNNLYIYVYDCYNEVQYKLPYYYGDYKLDINSDNHSIKVFRNTLEIGDLTIKDGKLAVKPKDNCYGFTIDNLKAISTSGEELNNIPKYGDCTVEMEIARIKSAVRRNYDNFFVAVYDKNGVLITIRQVRADFGVENKFTFGLNIPETTGEIGCIKAYIWDGFSEIIPLSDTSVLEV